MIYGLLLPISQCHAKKAEHFKKKSKVSLKNNKKSGKQNKHLNFYNTIKVFA